MKKLIFTIFASVLLQGFVFAQTQHVVFSDSPDNVTYGGTWANQNIQFLNSPANTLPVSTDTLHSGTNSLRFKYKTGGGTGLNWVGLVAVKLVGGAWTPMDFTNVTSIQMWFMSPVDVPANSLPLFQLNDANNVKSVGVKLGYAGGTNNLIANTWKRITVQMSSLTPGTNPYNKTSIKSLAYGQNEWNATSTVTLYVDDIVVNGDFATGINKTSKPAIAVVYNHGMLDIPTYSGDVFVYDMGGKMVKQVVAMQGKAAADLEKGIYIVHTKLGNGKIIVE